MNAKQKKFLKEAAYEVDKLIQNNVIKKYFVKQVNIFLKSEESVPSKYKECMQSLLHYAQEKQNHFQAVLKDKRLMDRDAGPPEEGWTYGIVGPTPGTETEYVIGWMPPYLLSAPPTSYILNTPFIQPPKANAVKETLPFCYGILAVIHDNILPAHIRVRIVSEEDNQKQLIEKIWKRICTEDVGYDSLTINTALDYIKSDINRKYKRGKIAVELDAMEGVLTINGVPQQFKGNIRLCLFELAYRKQQKIGEFLPRVEKRDGKTYNWKNALDMLRRQIGDDLYLAVGTAKSGYYLQPNVKVKGMGQVNNRSMRDSYKRVGRDFYQEPERQELEGDD